MRNEHALMLPTGVTARVDPGDVQSIQIFQGGRWVTLSRQELHALSGNFPLIPARGGAASTTCVKREDGDDDEPQAGES